MLAELDGGLKLRFTERYYSFFGILQNLYLMEIFGLMAEFSRVFFTSTGIKR
jgi:hypothetical protein